jgi:hypothetical protein
MKELKLLGTIKGKVNHYIYSATRNTYCILTRNQKEGRGRFFIIHNHELETVKSNLKSFNKNKFHPEDLKDSIKGLYGSNNLRKKSKQNEYLRSRISEICYLLCYQRYLKMKKEGNKIYFIKLQKLNKN